MGAEWFLDTNVIVYSFDASAPAKRSRARALIRKSLSTGHGLVSWQVAQEFCSLAVRKFAVPLTTLECLLYCRSVLFPLCRVWPSEALLRDALELVEETGYAYYDCLVIAAAVSAGARTLYTEDMQAGRRLRGVEIVNPFA